MDFEVTWIHERISRGHGWLVDYEAALSEAEAVGFVPAAPQHIRVEVKFAEKQQTFGDGVLTWSSDENHRGTRVNVPVLTIYFRDEDGAILSGMRNALRAAAISGDVTANCRIFKKFEKGWSDRHDEYRLSFDVTDVIVWSTLKSPRLAEWAAPPRSGFQDMSSFDDPRRLRATPKPGK